MKTIFCMLLLLTLNVLSQTFTGKVVNNLSQGLESKKVEVHLTIDGVYTKFLDWTDALGNFSADSASTSGINDENLLPDCFDVSLNYPQPFNPKTIFNVTLPHNSQISVDVFTILGERVFIMDKKEYPAGLSKLVIELNGFSNGVYIARINIDDKYFISRKMLLLYGSQHAKDFSVSVLNKNNGIIMLDSISVSGDAIYKKTVYYGQQITLGNYDVGNIQVDSHFVNLSLTVRKLMECTQTNNQQTNALVNVSGQEAMTDANGQAIFNNIPSGRNTLTITHPEIYTRETILRLENDSTHTEYILDTLNYPQVLMDFTDEILGKIINGQPYKMRGRWTEPPIFYIVADTTTEEGRWRANQQIAKIDTVLAPAYTTPQYPEGFLKNYQVEVGLNPPPTLTPGYYVIDWQNIAPNIGLTGVTSDTASGKILSARTTYNINLTPYEMDRTIIHELSSGLSATGRNNSIPSVWNLPVAPYEYRNFAPTDLQMILYQYSRPPGNKIVDKDDGF
jgi:hypothetical protein